MRLVLQYGDVKIDAAEVLETLFALEQALVHLESNGSCKEREHLAQFALALLPLLLKSLHLFHLFLAHAFTLHLLLR